MEAICMADGESGGKTGVESGGKTGVKESANGANNVSADHHNMSADRAKDNKKGGLTADYRTKYEAAREAALAQAAAVKGGFIREPPLPLNTHVVADGVGVMGTDPARRGGAVDSLNPGLSSSAMEGVSSSGSAGPALDSALDKMDTHGATGDDDDDERGHSSRSWPAAFRLLRRGLGRRVGRPGGRRVGRRGLGRRPPGHRLRGGEHDRPLRESHPPLQDPQHRAQRVEESDQGEGQACTSTWPGRQGGRIRVGPEGRGGGKIPLEDDPERVPAVYSQGEGEGRRKRRRAARRASSRASRRASSRAARRAAGRAARRASTSRASGRPGRAARRASRRPRSRSRHPASHAKRRRMD